MYDAVEHSWIVFVALTLPFLWCPTIKFKSKHERYTLELESSFYFNLCGKTFLLSFKHAQHRVPDGLFTGECRGSHFTVVRSTWHYPQCSPAVSYSARNLLSHAHVRHISCTYCSSAHPTSTSTSCTTETLKMETKQVPSPPRGRNERRRLLSVAPGGCRPYLPLALLCLYPLPMVDTWPPRGPAGGSTRRVTGRLRQIDTSSTLSSNISHHFGHMGVRRVFD